MTVVVCAAADHRFFELLHLMVLSVRHKPEGRRVSLAILDLGLTPEQRTLLGPLVDRMVEPGWDMRFATSGNQSGREAWRGFKAMTARPFLPRHFPGYETYVWIDSDAWVQDWHAVDCLVRAAAGGAIAIVPEIDRSYRTEYDRGRNRRWMMHNYRRFFGKSAAEALWLMPVLNSGVFALRHDAVHWQAWAEDFQAGLLRETDLTVEQTALNHAIYTRGLPHHFLPSRFNWLVNKALPKYDPVTGQFTDPVPPHEPLGIVHLSGDAKKTKHLLRCIDRRGMFGTWLRYRPERAVQGYEPPNRAPLAEAHHLAEQQAASRRRARLRPERPSE